jgi:hypothetical protein
VIDFPFIISCRNAAIKHLYATTPRGVGENGNFMPPQGIETQHLDYPVRMLVQYRLIKVVKIWDEERAELEGKER